MTFKINKTKKWKIVDYKNQTVKKGFNCWATARSFLSKIKLNSQEDLRVVEE